jgi:Phosphoserine phosphatase RsbU, N-terminal domain
VTTDPLARLRLDYRSALVGYLSRRDENQLAAAYEIGRGAITARVGLLDLVQVHNSVTLELMRAATGADDRLDVADAAAAFLVEVLASSEMAQRGFLEGARRPPENPG